MIVLKKLDRYILQKFLLIFVGAFFICLFVFMMQFTWRYVEELIGKGLSIEILAQFFWYMGITLVPQSLPLALLLASLITFGNLGESLELLAMKAAGIPLIRIMKPLAVIAFALAGVSFYFQNSTSPEAQINLRTLLFSMKQQSPAVEIPEGVFYNGVPNINLFVQKKNAETGMLYQTIIYKTDQGFERAQIVLADSARMEMTSDKMHLKLDLWNGEQFESLQAAGGSMIQSSTEQPYDRETFQYKQLIIDFDSNFNLMDKEMLSNMPSAKNMRQIEHSVDSIEQHLDSVGKQYYSESTQTYYKRPEMNRRDSLKLNSQLANLKAAPVAKFDTILAHTPLDKLNYARQQARSTIKSMKSDLEWKSIITSDGDNIIRYHWVEWHQKMTFSLACILFFFVGAPLGAIIRKGGLGMPTVISVIIFIIWYIIHTGCMKMARDGSINMAIGMWISTLAIAPFSIFFTYKANSDSVVFNIDAYKNVFCRLLGIRTKRHIARKEVIIDEPDINRMMLATQSLRKQCTDYNEDKQLLRAPSYMRIFFKHNPDHEVEAISQQMETIIEELSNSKDSKIIGILNEFPVLYTTAHTSPFNNSRLNRAAGVFFPVGMVLWFRIWRFRLRLLRDLRIIIRTCDRLTATIEGTASQEEGSGIEAEQTAESNKVKRKLRGVKIAVVIIMITLLGNLVWKGWNRQQRKKQMQRTEQASKQPATEAPATMQVTQQDGQSNNITSKPSLQVN